MSKNDQRAGRAELTRPQRDLLAVLPDEGGGKFLKGPRLRVADALVKLGLAEKVSTGYIGIGGRYRRTGAGSAEAMRERGSNVPAR